VIVDARQVSDVDYSLFDLVTEYIERHRCALAERVTRLTIVRPEGLLAAAAEGFFRVVAAPFPVDVVTERQSAFASLDGEALAREIEEIESLVTGASILPRLRELLVSAQGRTLAIRELARELGTSDRTLQRRLREEGTSLRREKRAFTSANGCLSRPTSGSMTSPQAVPSRVG
jgi:hypothetical protein